MSAHPGCNQYGHAPGCGHPGATGGPAEVAGVDLTAAQEAPPRGAQAVAAQCDEAGLPVMGDVYRDLHERGVVRGGYLLAHVTPGQVESDYEQHIGPVVDLLADRYSGNGGEKPLSDEARDHIVDCCHRAGLGNMVGIYGVLADRQAISEAAALAFSPADVTLDYEWHVAPAIDRVGRGPRAVYHADVVDQQSAEIDVAIEGLTTASDEVDFYPLVDAHREARADYALTGDLGALADSYDQMADDIEPWLANLGGDLDNPFWSKRVGIAQNRLRACADRLRRAADGLGL